MQVINQWWIILGAFVFAAVMLAGAEWRNRVLERRTVHRDIADALERVASTTGEIGNKYILQAAVAALRGEELS